MGSYHVADGEMLARGPKAVDGATKKTLPMEYGPIEAKVNPGMATVFCSKAIQGCNTLPI